MQHKKNKIFSSALPDWSLRTWVEKTAEAFDDANLYYGHGTDNAIDEAAYLICYALESDFGFSDRDVDAKINSSDAKKIKDLIVKRIETRQPVAYLVNEAWFTNMPFYVNENVLVPRSPFAELILEQFEPWVNIENCKTALEIGTGSGCIAIAMAKYIPHLKIDAVDISEDALAVAKINVEKHGMQEQVKLICSDIYEGVIDKKYDLIVSNPPYVDAQDMKDLPIEYTHEPRLGLASGDDGLNCVRGILAQAGQHLSDKGVLIVEVGNSQEHVVNAYPNLPLTWLEFEYGGAGVFLIDAKQLKQFFK